MPSLRDLLTTYHVNGKRVIVFESHNLALLPWADYAAQVGAPVRLLTLDYHTDTMPAFRRCIGQMEDALDKDFNFFGEVEARVRLVDRHNETSLQLATSQLKHDEHIDAAVRLGIVETAFVICHDGFSEALESNEQIALWESGKTKIAVSGGLVDDEDEEFAIWAPGTEVATGPFTYTLPDNRMVILPERTSYSWSQQLGEDDRENRDSALESEFLAERLALVDDICASTGLSKMFEAPFILDIDLDYFNTARAVRPADSAVFEELVRHAGLITIAREPSCVEGCALEGEDLSADQLETQLMRLIREALGDVAPPNA